VAAATPIRVLPEEERIARLRAYGVLDPDLALPALDELVKRAQEVASFPMAWLSFFDGKRERLRARAGVSFAYIAREDSFAFAFEPAGSPVFIEDLAAGDQRTHPLVASGPRARFVGILPLAASDGCVVGTLTVLDTRPRTLRKPEKVELENIASLAVARLEARREMGEARRASFDAPAARTPAERLEEEAGRRRAAEEELAREKQFSEAVLDSLAGAFYLLGPDGTILRWNSALVAAVGYTNAEIGSRNPLEFVSPKDRDAVEAAMRAVFEQGREMAIEAEIVDRGGNVRPYALSGKPLRVGDATFMIVHARAQTAVGENRVADLVDGAHDGHELGGQADFALGLASLQTAEAFVRRIRDHRIVILRGEGAPSHMELGCALRGLPAWRAVIDFVDQTTELRESRS